MGRVKDIDKTNIFMEEEISSMCVDESSSHREWKVGCSGPRKAIKGGT